MILPSKHLSRNRALLTVGARVLQSLSQPKTISSVWEELSRGPDRRETSPTLRYDRFVLALDLLFLIGAIQMRNGLLTRLVP